MARLSVERFIERTGLSLKRVAEESIQSNGQVYTLWEFGCLVEIEGVCPHGCHSIVAQLMLAGHAWAEICVLFSRGIYDTATPP